MSIVEDQAPFDLAIVKAMIESSPEDWTNLQLKIERVVRGKVGALQFELRDVVRNSPCVPLDNLVSAVGRLDEFICSTGRWLETATYHANFDGADWDWTAKWSYAERAH
jgi:hypothetical protein